MHASECLAASIVTECEGVLQFPTPEGQVGPVIAAVCADGWCPHRHEGLHNGKGRLQPVRPSVQQTTAGPLTGGEKLVGNQPMHSGLL